MSPSIMDRLRWYQTNEFFQGLQDAMVIELGNWNGSLDFVVEDNWNRFMLMVAQRINEDLSDEMVHEEFERWFRAAWTELARKGLVKLP